MTHHFGDITFGILIGDIDLSMLQYLVNGCIAVKQKLSTVYISNNLVKWLCVTF